MSDLPPPSPPPGLPPPSPMILPAPVKSSIEAHADAQREPSPSSPPPSQTPFPEATYDGGGGDIQADCDEDSTLGFIMYLLPLLGLSTLTASLHMPLGAVVAPLILWLLKKDNSRYLDAAGKEVVNFNICAVAAFLALAILHTVGSWIWLGPLFSFLTQITWLAWVVITVIGAYNAKGGHYYRFPFNYRVIK